MCIFPIACKYGFPSHWATLPSICTVISTEWLGSTCHSGSSARRDTKRSKRLASAHGRATIVEIAMRQGNHSLQWFNHVLETSAVSVKHEDTHLRRKSNSECSSLNKIWWPSAAAMRPSFIVTWCVSCHGTVALRRLKSTAVAMNHLARQSI